MIFNIDRRNEREFTYVSDFIFFIFVDVNASSNFSTYLLKLCNLPDIKLISTISLSIIVASKMYPF